MSTALEIRVEDYLRERVDTEGGKCIKLNPLWTVGIPDRLVLLPGGVAAFVECKSPSGKLRAMQRMWRRQLAEIGFTVHYPRTRDDVNELMKVLMK